MSATPPTRWRGWPTIWWCMEGGRVLGSRPLAETLARLDLPIRLGEDAGVVLDGRGRGARRRMASGRASTSPAAASGCATRASPLGRHVRVRILARDVSIAREQITGTSIMNTLPATVTALGRRHPPGARPGAARSRRRTAAGPPDPPLRGHLRLAPGLPVWVQIKAVALIG